MTAWGELPGVYHARLGGALLTPEYAVGMYQRMPAGYENEERRRKGMKAQKAVSSAAHRRSAAIGAFVCAAAICSAAALGRIARAEENPADEIVAITVDTVAADTDGNFTATVYLDELPDMGICALDFAIAYDPTVLTISDVELLYDTGAQAAEILVHPDFADTVFKTELVEGELRIRWVTGLRIRDYWLTETRAFFTVNGSISEQAVPGSCETLSITPATRDADEDSGEANAVIAAGYLDEEGNPHNCKTRLKDGAVWIPLDETGATMYGDINLDGEITVSDAVLLHRALAEQIALSAAAYANADCEFDGVLSMDDVTPMLRVINGDLDAAALGAY